MSDPAVFKARDSMQRQHLVRNLGLALDSSWATSYVASRAYEGDSTSLYLWSFYSVGLTNGMRWGRIQGREMAFDDVYGTTAQNVASRTRARTARRRKAVRR